MRTDYLLDAVTRVLPAGADPSDVAAWARQARRDGETRVGVIITEDGRVVAHTRHIDAWRIMDPESLFNPVLDMSWGRLEREAGGPVHHVRISEIGMKMCGHPTHLPLQEPTHA